MRGRRVGFDGEGLLQISGRRGFGGSSHVGPGVGFRRLRLVLRIGRRRIARGKGLL